MDVSKWMISVLGVYGILFLIGLILTVISSQLQCSKVSWGQSALQGSYWAIFPSIVFIFASYFEVIRRPFSNTLKSFIFKNTVSTPDSDHTVAVLAIGYLLMLSSWVSTVMATNNIGKAVCNPSVNEMTTFRNQLLNELKQKQEEEENNKNEPSNITVQPT